MKNNRMGGALKVMKGVDKKNNIGSEAVNRFKGIKRKKLEAKDYLDGILNGNITILSKAITLVESSLNEHQELAQEVIEKALPYSGKSVRIGITGVPGVGKSSLIETLGHQLLDNGYKLAVLAIDPSSEKSKGSILGDKTRMEKLSTSPGAYIRPSPSSGTLGGVARKTRETIVLCESAGFDIIFVETVGVGQSETAVYSMVDFFLLLMLAGAGDELQGIKRGIMEMADMVLITKADGNNRENAKRAQAEFKNAVHFFPPSESGTQTEVLTCSSKEKLGISSMWDEVMNYFDKVKGNNYFQKRRQQQNKYWMYETIQENLKQNFYSDKDILKTLHSIEKKVTNGSISPFKAAMQLLNRYSKNEKK